MSELMKITTRVHPKIARLNAANHQTARVGIATDETTHVILPTAILAIGSTALLFTGYLFLGAAGLIATPFVYSKLNDMNNA